MTPTNSRPILVTGAAGFIGAALCQRLLQRGDRVIGIDNLNTYYDPALKQARLEAIVAMAPAGAWRFERIALEEGEALLAVFAAERPKVVVNLAAQAGVRYSLENPAVYIQSNLVGFGHILEGCRHHGVEHLVYASSSSVYGGNRNLPFDERQPVNHPVSLYAASKKANELMAHYSHLYGLPATACAFSPCTALGAIRSGPMLFAKRSWRETQFRCSTTADAARLHLYRRHRGGVLRCCDKPATANPELILCPRPRHGGTASCVQHRQQPAHPLLRFIEVMEKALGCEAIKDFQPMQPGDVVATAANTEALEEWVGFKPSTPIEIGVRRFADWYRSFYGV